MSAAGLSAALDGVNPPRRFGAGGLHDGSEHNTLISPQRLGALDENNPDSGP